MFSYIYSKTVATVIRYAAVRTITTHEDEVIQVPSRDPQRTIKVHCYRPTAAQQPTPVLINFHGSGYVIPMHGSDDEFALKVKSDTNYTVLDVQYRLAPENPFPAAPNDAEDVVKYVLAHPEQYDVSHISVSGFSAGAALALGLCGHTFPKGTFRHVVAFYPPTDISLEPETKSAPDPAGKPIPDWLARTFNDFYAPHPIDRTEPLLSPAKMETSQFPDKALIITCAYDNLAHEAEAFADKLKEEPGRYVECKRMEGCNHGWDKAYKAGTMEEKAKDEAYGMAMKMLQS